MGSRIKKITNNLGINKVILLLLLLVFFVALTLRLFSLGATPAGFHRDEVISGYVGRFVIENGKDIAGNTFPLLYFDKYGDYPPVIPMYLSGISTYVFGMTVFATRFPVALIGALLIFPLFFLTREFFKDDRIGFAAAFILAFLPWHLILSRSTSEGIVALTIAVTAFVYLLKFVRTQKPILLLVSFILLLLTYFIYPSYRVFVPIALLPVPFLFALNKKSKIFLFGAIFIFVLSTLLISQTAWGKGRFEQTSVFTSKNSEDIKSRSSILAQEEGSNNIREVKIYHNKFVLLGKQIINQYFEYFSPNYLFISGGLPYRYAVPDEGLFFLIMIPLLLAGLIFLKDIGWSKAGYLIYLLLISPMPAPITIDDIPNVHRTLFMIIPIVLLAAFGFVRLLDLFKLKLVKIVFAILILGVFSAEFVYFQHMYYKHSNAIKSIERGDTNKEVIKDLISQKNNFDKVYISVNDAFPIYYLYFTGNFDKSIIGKFEKNLITSKIDNVTFRKKYCPEKELTDKQLSGNILIVDRNDCEADERFKTTKVYDRHDGTTSYRFSVLSK